VKCVLDFGGISSAIVVDYNSTLVFQDLRIQGTANPSPNGLPLDTPAGYVPQAATGSTLVAYPGATVRATPWCFDIVRRIIFLASEWDIHFRTGWLPEHHLPGESRLLYRLCKRGPETDHRPIRRFCTY
jgi:hypothetical protein